MKNRIYIILIGIVVSCTSNPKQEESSVQSIQKLDSISKKRSSDSIRGVIHSEFNKHFHVLDSASKAFSVNQIECCGSSAWFMEVQTRIESEGEKGYVGIMSFTKNDLRKWHQWFDNYKDSLTSLLSLH